MSKRFRLVFGLLAIFLLGAFDSSSRVVQVSSECICTFISSWGCGRPSSGAPPAARIVSCEGICWPDQLESFSAEKGRELEKEIAK